MEAVWGAVWVAFNLESSAAQYDENRLSVVLRVRLVPIVRKTHLLYTISQIRPDPGMLCKKLFCHLLCHFLDLILKIFLTATGPCPYPVPCTATRFPTVGIELRGVYEAS